MSKYLSAQRLHNEEALMLAFRQGNKSAFEVVYAQMVRPLTCFAENVIHSREEAEDIVANAFYKLFHARTTLRSFDHVRRWLFVTVRHESIDFLRLKNKQKSSRNDLAYLDSGIEELAETERVRAMLLQDLQKEIDRLPKQRKTILRLYFYEKKKTPEIARIMKLNPQTVLNHKTKAIDALRKSGLCLKWPLDGIPGFLIAAALVKVATIAYNFL